MNSQKQNNSQQHFREVAKQVVNMHNDVRREPWKFVPMLKQRIENYDGLFYFTAEKRMTAIHTE